MGRNPCQRLHLFSLTFSTHFARISDSHVDELLGIVIISWLLLLYWISHGFIVLC